ncbi:chemotaxis protein CheD [Acidihalobacter prosperus]|uniref:Probable chemoreceptor glutamine deamidase CheD n=1 Tax=Acidihalobacter prosperus TaxID=160660 RepID=A0A1A6C5M5_9GAMM|nr:chemotaxis protein CheD [Acidihalobacter prosperus]OBS09871.1 Chemotaxis protein CheD [Acidihalobacter prosperus]
MYLTPGGFYFGKAGTRIKTILGSCVAVTLWHPELRCGGMGHFMLPCRGQRRAPQAAGEWDGKYADEMMHLFMARIRSSRTHPRDYEVKLFGGGNMFPALKSRPAREGVSARNVEAARVLMAAYGFKVAAEHLGGDGHRSLVLDLDDGLVYLWYKSMKS